jgi:hypothetical protein
LNASEPDSEVDVPNDNGAAPKTREWTVSLFDPAGNINRDPVLEALHDVEAIGHREGGLFVIAPHREPVEISLDEEGSTRTEWVTVGWTFKHEFAPPVRRTPRPQRQPEPEPEPEPVSGEVLEPAQT